MDKSDLILEFLKEFKTDVNRRFEEIDKRFEQVDKRFEQIDKRFEQIDNQLDDIRYEIRDIKTEIREDQKKLQDVYDSRHEVEYKITRDFIIKNLGWNAACIVAGVVVFTALFDK